MHTDTRSRDGKNDRFGIRRNSNELAGYERPEVESRLDEWRAMIRLGSRASERTKNHVRIRLR